ncbi:MAG: PAS domain S-box protein [Acidobacteriota bacterium]
MADAEQPLRILVVDDDPAIRLATSRVLRKRGGFEVLEAATGEECLEAAQEEQPDLVLLDVNLPDGSGFEVCRRIKGSPETAHILVAHLSASHRETMERVAGLEGGADAYLVHPIEPDVLVATVRSLARIRTAEEGRRREAGRLRALCEAALDAVILLDDEGRVILWSRSAERLFGYSREEAEGRNVHDMLVPPDSLARAQESLRAFLGLAPAERRGRIHQVTARRKDGSEFPAELSVSPLSVEGSGGVVGIVRDISERRAAEESARRAREAELRERHLARHAALARGAANEARNPLFALQANLTALLRRLPDDEALRPFAENMKEHASRLDGLMKNLVELGSLPQEDEWAECTLQDLLQAARSDVAGSHPGFCGVWETAWPLEPVRLRGVPTRLTGLFRELLTNAVEFSPPKGTVEVAIRREGAWWIVTVADQGPGLAPAAAHALFEPFRTTRRGRAGLGLALAAHVAEFHGGRIEGGDGPQGGAIFTVRLPAKKEADGA